MLRRADQMLAGVDERQRNRVAKLRLPRPAPCGRVPLTAAELSKYYGSLEVFTDVDLAIDRSSRVVILGLNGAGKTTLLRLLAGQDEPDTGEVRPGHGLRLGYYAQEHEQLDTEATVLANMLAGRPTSTNNRLATYWARSCSVATTCTNRPGCCPVARRPGWHWRCWSSAVPTFCSWMSRRTTWTRPAARRSLAALHGYEVR